MNDELFKEKFADYIIEKTGTKNISDEKGNELLAQFIYENRYSMEDYINSIEAFKSILEEKIQKEETTPDNADDEFDKALGGIQPTEDMDISSVEDSAQEELQDNKPKKHNLIKKNIVKIAIVAVLGAVLGGGGYITFSEHQKDIDTAAAIETYAETPTYDISNMANAENREIQGPNFDELEQQYPGVVGFVQGGLLRDGYPVMPGDIGDTNTKYLNHLPNGDANSIGSICFNENNNPNLTDDVSVMFAHNNGVFNVIGGYGNEENAVNYMYYFTRNGCYELQPFAYTIEDDLKSGDMSDEEKMNYIGEVKNNSSIHPAVEIGLDDRVMAVYTCLDTNDPNYYLKPNDRQVVWFKVNPVYENLNEKSNQLS